jgi:hypothetical protein
MQRKLQNNLYLRIDRIENPHQENQVMEMHSNSEKLLQPDKKTCILAHPHQHQELEELIHLMDRLLLGISETLNLIIVTFKKVLNRIKTQSIYSKSLKNKTKNAWNIKLK